MLIELHTMSAAAPADITIPTTKSPVFLASAGDAIRSV